MMVSGWKGVLKYLDEHGIGVSLRTLKKWHYERIRIPFRKTYPGISGRVYIAESELERWLNNVTSNAR